MTLYQFIHEESDAIERALRITVKDLKRYMCINSEEYTEPGCNEPAIDIRLCVDIDDSEYHSSGWIIRTGLSDYDTYHSQYCAASCVTLNTKPEQLLTELLNELVE